MRDFGQLLRHIFSSVRRDRGVTTTIVITLGVGVGAMTAAMNVAAGVLVKPLPIRDESRLLLISRTLRTGTTLVPFSYAELTAWADASRTLDGVAGVQYDGAWPSPAEQGDRAMTVTGAAVSGNFFEVLGARPTVGRLLRQEDAAAGAERVAVIGYGLWRARFGGDPAVIGKALTVDGTALTIVGVAPRGLAFPDGCELWRPLDIAPDTINEGWFNLVARLRPDATLPRAAEESAALVRQLRAVARKGLPSDLLTVTIPFKDAIVGEVRPVLVLFVAAAVLLLLVACVNAANLLVIRGAARQREMALRAALGATRARLVRELFTQSTVVAVAAGVLGAIVAFWLQRALIAVAPTGVPRLDAVDFDARTVGFAAAACLSTIGITGTVPAIWTARRSLFGSLRSDGMSEPGTKRALAVGQALVAVQLAFALLVSLGAALLLRSLLQLQRVDIGLRVDRVSVVHVPLVAREYRNPKRRLQLFEELVRGMESQPGIAGATPVLLRPFTGAEGWDATVAADGQAPAEALANPGLHLEAVLPNYFATLGIPIRQGRAFDERDREGGQPVVIVSHSLARRVFGAQDPLGKRLKFGGASSSAPWMTVVGVAADVRYRDVQAPPPAIYVPLFQTPFPPRFLIVRTAIDDVPVLAVTRLALREIDPAEPVLDATSIADLLRAEHAAPRFRAIALGLFSMLAVVLAGVGVFGVLAAYVAQRPRELGVRIALGATPARLRGLVLSRLVLPTAVGLALGTCAALAGRRFVQPLLFDVSALDATAFVAGWLTLGLAAAAASLVPLRRAARVDPIRLLRAD